MRSCTSGSIGSSLYARDGRTNYSECPPPPRIPTHEHHHRHCNSRAKCIIIDQLSLSTAPNPRAAEFERVFEVRGDPEWRAGLFTRKALVADDIYLRIPWDLVMDCDKAIQSPLIGEALLR